MKPQATMDTKDVSTVDMAPVQIIQPAPQRKGGVTAKHILIAVTSVIALGIIVGGFIAGFHLMKQTADRHSEDMTKVFQMKVNDGKREYKEQVKTNVKDDTTEVDTKDDKGQDGIIYNDFKKGITVFVTGGDISACFVSPMNRSNVEDPKALQKYMESHPNPEMNADNATKEDIHLTPSDDAIPDTSFLGPKINELCSGKNIYWMYPGKNDKDETSRQKRACYYRYYRICYRILWYRRCYIFRRIICT